MTPKRWGDNSSSNVAYQRRLKAAGRKQCPACNAMLVSWPQEVEVLLLDCLRDLPDICRLRSASSSSRNRLRPFLIRTLLSNAKNASEIIATRQKAINALLHICDRGDPSLTAMLLPGLTDVDLTVRVAFILAVGKLAPHGDEVAVSRIVDQLAGIYPGDTVCVSSNFESDSEVSVVLQTGQLGEVIELDEDGDAEVKFGRVHEWIGRRNFQHLVADSHLHESMEIRLASIKCLQEIAVQGDVSVIAALLAQVEHSNCTALGHAALQLMIRIAGKRDGGTSAASAQLQSKECFGDPMRLSTARSIADVEFSGSQSLIGETISEREWERSMKHWRHRLKALRLPKSGSGKVLGELSTSQAKLGLMPGPGLVGGGPNPYPSQARPSSTQPQNSNTGSNKSDSNWLTDLRRWIGGLIAYCSSLKKLDEHENEMWMKTRKSSGTVEKRRNKRVRRPASNSASSQGPPIPLHIEVTVCNFGRMCKRKECFHQHPQGRVIDDDPSASLCRFGSKCSRLNCFYEHV